MLTTLVRSWNASNPNRRTATATPAAKLLNSIRNLAFRNAPPLPASHTAQTTAIMTNANPAKAPWDMVETNGGSEAIVKINVAVVSHRGEFVELSREAK